MNCDIFHGTKYDSFNRPGVHLLDNVTRRVVVVGPKHSETRELGRWDWVRRVRVGDMCFRWAQRACDEARADELNLAQGSEGTH